MTTQPHGHSPVLPRQVDELLAVQPGDTVVDATVGLGGHAERFSATLGDAGRLIGLDVDPSNLERTRLRLAQAACRVDLVHANFAELPRVLAKLEVAGVDVVLADLGVSSTQLDTPERGFSFQADGPLDMRMDPRLEETAADLVNRMKERELADLIWHFSQEPASRRIAKAIIEARRDNRITTTGRLVEVVARALRVDPASRKSKIHPATRTFQALRIAVNDEIGCLERLLEVVPHLLNPGGRFGVIAFHSIEDRPIKQDFRRRKTEREYELLTKKPVVADEDERRDNPRSRSAKLRVARRVEVG